jgi:hypothetical protein
MDVGASLVAGGEAAVGMQPCEGAFHDPAPATEVLGGFNTATSNPRNDAAYLAASAAEDV